MPPRLPFVVAALILLGGCSSAIARTGPIVVGPTAQREPERLFASAVEVARQAGYQPFEIDPLRGEYRVLARSHGFHDQPVLLIVQVYADGWARVIPAGPGARRDETHVIVPATVEREHLRFGVALTSALRPAREEVAR